MAQVYEQRIRYRRYEDRRVAMMLTIHELLFEMQPGKKRDEMILKAIRDNFKVDRAAFISMSNTLAKTAELRATVGDWTTGDGATMQIGGRGFERLLSLHKDVDGALSFESVRKPDRFSQETWDSLWREGMGGPARALLSLEIRPKKSLKRLIWLQQTSSSREWSSRDRDLIEEIADLLARALDKDA